MMTTPIPTPIGVDQPPNKTYYLHKFRLYQTPSKFYMIGSDKSKAFWRVLKIDRSEPTELNLYEDPTIYTEAECYDILMCLREGNRSIGGLRFVTICYGIIGFIKFVGPYYMILITKRRKIGAIGMHIVYAITKSEVIPLLHSTCNTNTKTESRYKKLLYGVDLTKDFFFSYSYHVMCSLQNNLCKDKTGKVLYGKMFVWNEFLTRGIRHQLKTTLWTVALVYGFFKQVKLFISGKDFKLTLIARRSRHYAGTRYLKRGVNKKGRVANDVETEQILFEDAPEGCPMQISSVVQHRGSIPLFWSQETSRLNIKPNITVSENSQNYEATRLHFENLFVRYGNPIIILNLIKTCEKKPRESILHGEFANAIEYINRDLSEENRLKAIHWDLNKHSRRNRNVLVELGKLATCILNLTGFFYCQVTPKLTPEGSLQFTSSESTVSLSSAQFYCNDGREPGEHNNNNSGKQSIKAPMFQRGVLRTNCIDCLDRTNVAQYSYGLVALGNQLHALGFLDVPKLDLSSPVADDLMRLYEMMGDTLALQYGGSPAHNKVFSEERGQWKPAIQSQELLILLQRYYNNAYMDAEKQDAINIFLGHFQPQEGRPALWELDSDQHFNVGSRNSSFGSTSSRLSFKRSLSDGDILGEGSTSISENVWMKELSNSVLSERKQEGGNNLSECTFEISNCDTDISYKRYTPSMTQTQVLMNMQSDGIRIEDPLNSSNFVDLGGFSSSGYSCEEELHERHARMISPLSEMPSKNVLPEIMVKAASRTSKNGPSAKELNPNGGDEFSDSFAYWINCGETLCKTQQRK